LLQALIRRSLPALGIAAAAVCFLSPIRNPDLWWHLNAARLIHESGLPRTEVFSHALFGQPWLDFEWLTQLLYGAVHAVAGFPGLMALRLILLMGVVAALLRLLSLHGIGAAGRGLAALTLGCALFPFADLRPDNFSLLFFSALLLWAEGRRLGRFRLGRLVAAAIFSLFALWANLHLGLIYGLLLLGMFAAGAALDAALPWISSTEIGRAHV
jgi:hypothetical protein